MRDEIEVNPRRCHELVGELMVNQAVFQELSCIGHAKRSISISSVEIFTDDVVFIEIKTTKTNYIRIFYGADNLTTKHDCVLHVETIMVLATEFYAEGPKHRLMDHRLGHADRITLAIADAYQR